MPITRMNHAVLYVRDAPESEHEAIIEPLDIDAGIAHFAVVGLA